MIPDTAICHTTLKKIVEDNPMRFLTARQLMRPDARLTAALQDGSIIIDDVPLLKPVNQENSQIPVDNSHEAGV